MVKALYLLDADAVIDYIAGIPDSVNLITDIHYRGTLATCDVVIAEVYAGLKPEVRDKAERLLRSMRFLPTSVQVAIRAGRWCYDFARQGIILPITDTLIAATAHACQAHLVTGNMKDYPMA